MVEKRLTKTTVISKFEMISSGINQMVKDEAFEEEIITVTEEVGN